MSNTSELIHVEHGLSASDNQAVFRWGLHELLAFVDDLGAVEIPAAHLPVPAGARSRGMRRAAGDPFTDPRRPLRLTLAADVVDLPVAQQRCLAAIGELRGIEVDALPGAVDARVVGPHRVTITLQDDGISVESSGRPDTVAGTFFDPSLARLLEMHLGIRPELADQLNQAIAAHEALGNDYLVSPTLVGQRASDAFWGGAIGTASGLEALFLGGVKSRMYGMSRLNALSAARVSTNQGVILDRAAMSLVPTLGGAMAGSLAPTADPAERGAASHLLAIRSLLRDLLFARDDVVRLERREALGSDWRGTGRHQPEEGETGNDLAYRYRYHVTAVLNTFTAILDNLAWVVVSREQLTPRSHAVGFEKLLGFRPSASFPQTRPTPILQDAAARTGSAVARALALRALRNQADHQVGLSYGRVRSVKFEPTMKGPEMFAAWLWKGSMSYPTGVNERRDAFDELIDVGAFAAGNLGLLRPRPLAELAIACAARITADVLALYPWTDATWLGSPRKGRPSTTDNRPYRGRWQRYLWGVDVTHPTALAVFRDGAIGRGPTPDPITVGFEPLTT